MTSQRVKRRLDGSSVRDECGVRLSLWDVAGRRPTNSEGTGEMYLPWKLPTLVNHPSAPPVTQAWEMIATPTSYGHDPMKLKMQEYDIGTYNTASSGKFVLTPTWAHGYNWTQPDTEHVTLGAGLYQIGFRCQLTPTGNNRYCWMLVNHPYLNNQTATSVRVGGTAALAGSDNPSITSSHNFISEISTSGDLYLSVTTIGALASHTNGKLWIRELPVVA